MQSENHTEGLGRLVLDLQLAEDVSGILGMIDALDGVREPLTSMVVYSENVIDSVELPKRFT